MEEYHRAVLFGVTLITGVFLGMMIMGQAIEDGSIPQCKPEFYDLLKE